MLWIYIGTHLDSEEAIDTRDRTRVGEDVLLRVERVFTVLAYGTKIREITVVNPNNLLSLSVLQLGFK